jgi:hypothetical protein
VAGSEVLRRPGVEETGPSEYLRPGHQVLMIIDDLNGTPLALIAIVSRTRNRSRWELGFPR